MHMAAGSCQAKGQDVGRVVLKVTVEVTADRSETILVREGDFPEVLAEEFCRRHGLQLSLVTPLSAHIQANMDASAAEKPPPPVADQLAFAGPSQRQSSGQQAVGSTTPPARTAQSQGHHAPSAAGTPRQSSDPSRPAAVPRTPVHGTHGAFTQSARGPVERPTFGTPARAGGAAVRAHRLPHRAAGCHEHRGPRPRGGPRHRAALLLVKLREPAQVQALGRLQQCRTFERLHLDAEQRKARLQRLRQQVEHDLEEQHLQAGSQVPPGTLRSHAWHRDMADVMGLGERLYRDAEQRRVRMEWMQLQNAAQKKRQDMEEATFRPSIGASQRSCRGVGRSMRDPKGLTTRTKLERLREMREETQMEGCTFQPQIDQKSEELMQERLSRMNWVGNLHDALYDDAMRRQERQLEAQKMLPAGVTFHPDIGENHRRPPNDDTKEDFVNRLAYSKCYSERWHEEQQENGMHEGQQSQPDFQPQVGRGPLVDRNTEGLPIGDFLYKCGKEKALQQAKYEEQEREKSQASTPRVGDVSRFLFQETKQRKYRALYEALAWRDPEGLLRAETLSMDSESLDIGEMDAWLRPVIAYLNESGEAISFETFAAALDHERRNSAVPTAGALVRKTNARTCRLGSGDYHEEDFASQSQRSGSVPAPRRRSKNLPLHEQLHRERELRESRLQERRLQREEQELRECTFQPKVRARSASSSRQSYGSRQHSVESRSRPGMRSDGSAPLLSEGRSSASTGQQGVASRTPRSSRTGGPPGVLVNQLSLFSGSHSGSGTITPRPEFDEFEPSIGDFCREQIDQVEQAVAHCKTVVAMAK
eukprot:CAMPEP_0115576144 /NCGR_PEP_ID=MMETSP0272-20121206/2405_1 /TAXON_ID=71861 /ORGANISM="Scrippsiella trochoidea, Strain CCMP3099" /LENGTH=818 /DNA_ID=CAMNT_0003010915 /DNA_START=12 /DNA_END=2465 /DNA_ORIENTATION=+